MSSKYAYKQLPTFSLIYYRQWASDVKDAFAERDWINYLEPPTDSTDSKETEFVPEPHIVAQAKALMSQSIPYEHKTFIDDCRTK